VAAVAYPLAQGPTTSRPRLVVVVPGPALRPCPGSRRAAAVYRRRRAVALALLVMGAVVVGLALRAAVFAGPGSGPITATGSSSIGVLQPAAVHIHVVQPGETLWSIVRGTGGSGDPRPVIDRLEHQLRGRPLQVGQRLVLP
jgi:hypothetical protein